MDRLQALRKKSRSALGKLQLVAIACISKSPSNAYNLARRYDWDERNAQSARSLAAIYFEFGSDKMREVLSGVSRGFMDRICSNPEHHEKDGGCECGRYDQVCFCRCHFCRDCDFGVDSCAGNCDCECHNNEEDKWCQVCADWHTGEEREDEEVEDEEVEEEVEECNDDDDSEDEDDDDDDSSDDDDDDSSDDDDESQEERLCRIAERLAEAGSGFDGEFEVVDEIDGARLQACAFHGSDGDYVRVTDDLMEELDDDELAFVLSHEIAHHEHRDNQRLREFAEESSEALTMGLKSLNDGMKTEGRGWLTRGLVMTGATLLGTAAGVAAVRGSSRKHEDEADERGIELAVAAGFDPDKAESALVKIHGGYLPDIGVMGTLMSGHPNPATRGSAVQRRAERHKIDD